MKIKFFDLEFEFDAKEIKDLFQPIGNFWFNFWICRCPKCKSRKVSFFEYLGDEAVPRYKCYECGGDSIMVGNGLVQVEIK